MLFFLTLLMSPFFPQDGMIMESAYVQETEDDEDESVVLLGYNSSENPSGRVMTISAESGDEEAVTEEEDNEEDSETEDVTQKSTDDQEGEIQDVKHITKELDREFGEMRMILLANNIAQDMEMVLKVSFN